MLRQEYQDIRAALSAVDEEARRANMAKTDFLRRMSHDIRTPINGIRGVVSMAEHFPDDLARQKECRDKVMQASGFLLDLVNDVLDMNRLESGTIVLEHKPFDLTELLEETCGIIQMQGQAPGCAFRPSPGAFSTPICWAAPSTCARYCKTSAGTR